MLTTGDELPAQVPVYQLSFTDPDRKTIQKAYYCILRRLDGDRELADQLVMSNELYGSGHGWLMKTAIGLLDVSDSGTEAQSEYLGIQPVIRYKDTTMLLTTALQTKTGDILTIAQNGNELDYCSAEFTAALDALSYHVRMDIDLKTGKFVSFSSDTYGESPDIDLVAKQWIWLASEDATEEELIRMIEEKDEEEYYVYIPASHRTAEISLEALDDPDDYVVTFFYKTDDGEVHASEPVPLSSFPVSALER